MLDTNVCIDLFVFRDQRWTRLLTALQEGKLEAVTRTDCRKEWLYVLQYPHLPLDDSLRQQAIEEFDTLIQCIDPVEPDLPIQLPVCRDPQDQKFLKLAYHAKASVLITQDKALLKLAKRNLRAGLFQILTPESWLASYRPEQHTSQPSISD